jgi:hypothetical protein
LDPAGGLQHSFIQMSHLNATGRTKYLRSSVERMEVCYTGTERFNQPFNGLQRTGNPTASFGTGMPLITLPGTAQPQMAAAMAPANLLQQQALLQPAAAADILALINGVVVNQPAASASYMIPGAYQPGLAAAASILPAYAAANRQAAPPQFAMGLHPPPAATLATAAPQMAQPLVPVSLMESAAALLAAQGVQGVGNPQLLWPAAAALAANMHALQQQQAATSAALLPHDLSFGVRGIGGLLFHNSLAGTGGANAVAVQQQQMAAAAAAVAAAQQTKQLQLLVQQQQEQEQEQWAQMLNGCIASNNANRRQGANNLHTSSGNTVNTSNLHQLTASFTTPQIAEPEHASYNQAEQTTVAGLSSSQTVSGQLGNSVQRKSRCAVVRPMIDSSQLKTTQHPYHQQHLQSNPSPVSLPPGMIGHLNDYAISLSRAAQQQPNQ